MVMALVRKVQDRVRDEEWVRVIADSLVAVEENKTGLRKTSKRVV